MRIFCLLLIFLFLISCKGISQNQNRKYSVTKSEAEWKDQLPEMAYYVLRKAGTERAFSGPLNFVKDKGTYVCAGCQAPLYKSKYKFESGTGWPSFDRGVEENLEYDVDYKIGYPRSELKCNKCGGHLGHMFSDGPQNTTGKRHCINSAALNFIPTHE
jgi:peptide-methionine (R)-S-oxide reductase